MTPENFCYWLQGYLELRDPKKAITPAQVELIQKHLELVITPVITTTTAKISLGNTIPTDVFNPGTGRIC